MRLVLVSIIWFVAFIAFGCVPASSTATTTPIRTVQLSATGKSLSIPSAESNSCLPPHSRRDQAIVKKIIGGDSVEVAIGGVAFTVRYLGIDSPDVKLDPSGAEAATAQNRAWVDGQAVTLVRDVSEVDPPGRLLRFVLSGGMLVNERLLRGGFVRMAMSAPDVSCEKEFGDAERAARESRLGIWRFDAAELTKTAVAACTGVCLTPSPGCIIKGNINAKGEKIYHLPGGRGYAQTVIELAKGERWFCNEAEAREAGWRKG